jgi:cobyrinic acid ac-diamide synthase
MTYIVEKVVDLWYYLCANFFWGAIMGKVISFSNQKGGVGKTTTAINMAAYVALNGRKVLLIDFDPQGNATSGYGIEKNQLNLSCYDFLMGECQAQQVILPTMIDGLSILPCNIDLAAAEVDLVSVPQRETALRRAIAPIRDNYDYIFIDCPPSLGLITLNALCAADSVIIPIQSEFFALEGLSQLMNTIRIVKQRLNSTLTINGVVLTMYDSRTTMSKQVTEELYKYFGAKIYTVPVPRNVRLVESPSYGVPVVKHAPKCTGAAAYDALAKQFLEREEH